VLFWKFELTDVDTNLRILSTHGEQPIKAKCDETSTISVPQGRTLQSLSAYVCVGIRK
jgi:hypothetical protein